MNFISRKVEPKHNETKDILHDDFKRNAFMLYFPLGLAIASQLHLNYLVNELKNEMKKFYSKASENTPYNQEQKSWFFERSVQSASPNSMKQTSHAPPVQPNLSPSPPPPPPQKSNGAPPPPPPPPQSKPIPTQTAKPQQQKPLNSPNIREALLNDLLQTVKKKRQTRQLTSEDIENRMREQKALAAKEAAEAAAKAEEDAKEAAAVNQGTSETSLKPAQSVQEVYERGLRVINQRMNRNSTNDVQNEDSDWPE